MMPYFGPIVETCNQPHPSDQRLRGFINLLFDCIALVAMWWESIKAEEHY